MAGARRSARQAAKTSSSPNASQSKPPAAAAAGSKRKAESKGAPKGKRGKKGGEKEQTSIEDSLASNQDNGVDRDTEMKDESEEKAETSNGVEEVAKREEEIRDQEDMADDGKDEPATEKKEAEANGDSNGNQGDDSKNGFDALMNHDSKDDDKHITQEGTGSKVSAADNAVEKSSEREEALPSNILEKGIIYFFFRGRVGINEPSDVNDVARSYIILRPIPQGAKLGEGPIGDTGNVRMLSLPKKVLPVSPKDRFMTFVEKANASLEDGMCALRWWIFAKVGFAEHF